MKKTFLRKTFEVDWDSYVEIDQLIKCLKCRIGVLNPRPSKKERFRQKLNKIQNVFEADISFLYDKEYDKTQKYYVYAHMKSDWKIAIGYNPISTFAATLGMTHVPFYIGKGCDNRAFNINRNETHKKMKEYLQSSDKEVIVHIIKDQISEKEAFILEDKLIDIFGLRVFGGLLTNLDEGCKPKERRLYYNLNEIR